MLKCAHIRSTTAQRVAEVLSGFPLGAITSTALKTEKKKGGWLNRTTLGPALLASPIKSTGAEWASEFNETGNLQPSFTAHAYLASKPSISARQIGNL